MSQARGDSLLKLTKNRESLISHGFRTRRICQNGGNWTIQKYQWICCGWKRFHTFVQRILRAHRLSRITITSSDRSRSIGICWNFGCRSTGTVATRKRLEVWGAYFTRNRTVRTTILTESDHRNSGAALLPQLFRAAASTDNRWTVASKIWSCVKAKACINWIQSTRLENNPSKMQNTKDMMNS